MHYDAGSFANIASTPFAQQLWNTLRSAEYVAAMETATQLRHPAVKGLEELLLRDFKEQVLEDRVKQMIGHMVKQVMDARGYEIDQQKVKIDSIPFYAGTRYKRRDEWTYHVWRKGSDPRSCALTIDKAGTQLPALAGDRWIYYRSFSGWLRGAILFPGCPAENEVRTELRRQGFCLVQMPRLMRAA